MVNSDNFQTIKYLYYSKSWKMINGIETATFALLCQFYLQQKQKTITNIYRLACLLEIIVIFPSLIIKIMTMNCFTFLPALVFMPH